MIIEGEALEELRKLESDSVDFVCTDPPYGYSFMNRDWDRAVPHTDIWQECLRVLKPGAFINVMSAPRSDVLSRMIVNIESAGFRVDFTPIYWTYASGFPKAGNIGKLVDKRLGVEREVTGIQKLAGTARRMKGGNFGDFGGEDTADVINLSKATSPQAKALDGSYAGFQPKPAVEVIIVAMKPLSEKTFVDQALKNGKGISWLDDGRIPTDVSTMRPNGKALIDTFKGQEGKISGSYAGQGRFPANLLVSDNVLNDGVERKSLGNQDIPDYDATPNGVYGKYGKRSFVGHKDSGSYSRYFDLDKWAQTLPFLIVPKASKSEKNNGLDTLSEKLTKGGENTFKAGKWNIDPRHPDGGYETKHGTAMKNHHPTVKPLKLMSYLITLFSREGDTVLDPFVGSGTTCLAAKRLNRKYIGIERESEYIEIANNRLIELQVQLF